MGAYTSLVHVYFPPDEWVRAECVSGRECPPGTPSYPRCVQDAGMVMGPSGRLAPGRAYGLFGLLDLFYDPRKNPLSPLTEGQWNTILDPNMNTWAAATIWSRYGWRAWSDCAGCVACEVPGGAIPHWDAALAVLPGTPDEGYSVAEAIPLLIGMGLQIAGSRR